MDINLALVALIFAQQAFFMWQIQKLVDKAKSTSYTEYVNAKKPKEKKVIQQGAPDDFGPLKEFSQQIL